MAKRTQPPIGTPITPAECDVLIRLREGLTVKAIALDLNLPHSTIMERMKRLRVKTGARTNVQLAVWAHYPLFMEGLMVKIRGKK